MFSTSVTLGMVWSVNNKQPMLCVLVFLLNGYCVLPCCHSLPGTLSMSDLGEPTQTLDPNPFLPQRNQCTGCFSLCVVRL